jgi:photosystem II stability/assembly factor-like uncharacterized protein
MKKWFLYVLSLITLTSLMAQVPKLDLDQMKNLKFRNIGPAGMSGRVNAIDVDLSNDNRIYVGAASGGVWLSENGGTSWKPIFDEQNTQAIGSIKINQQNPSEIWVGTGEGNPRNSLNTGNGIYRSLDGGKTWKNMGLKNTKTIHRIFIHPTNPSIVYAAAMGSPWGANAERGVFRTKDSGKTWEKVLYVNDLTGAAEMVVDPTNPNKIIVGMWEHLRRPWTFTSGGKGSGLYITYDGGDNWKKVEDGLPKGDLGRFGLAIAPSNPKIVYALVEAKDNALYKSVDGGEKWSMVTKDNIGGRPFYYHELYVDPVNENRIYNLHTYVTLSEDGGRTFRNIMDYSTDVHPDHHAFWIHPKKPEYLINGNDGGMAISHDRGENWYFVNNLPVGQFYHVNVDNDFPYNVYGGMQDNGSWVGPSSVLKAGGIRNNDFLELYFGDGFDVVPNLENPRFGYAMSQGGNVGYYDRLTGNTKFIKPTHEDTTELRYNWNAAIAQDPDKNSGVYYGSQFLHYSDDHGESWKKLSPDLTTNDKTRQKPGESGGLTIDATGAENFCTILAIAPSPKDKNVIWVGTDDGNLQLTTDGGKNWSNVIANIKSAPKNAWIPQIEVSKSNPAEAFVIINNYRNNDYSAYAYHTADYGKTWTRIADDTQIAGFTISIVQHPNTPNLLFLGTDTGLYVSFDKGTSWQLINKGFPQVQVADMKIQERENDLVIGTFGRAFWILDNISIFEAIAKDKNVLTKDLAVFAPNPGYQVTYKSVDGIRFKGQGEFTGTNYNIGTVNIPVWKKPSGDKDKASTPSNAAPEGASPAMGGGRRGGGDGGVGGGDPKNRAKVSIVNEAGDTIRRFSSSLSDGLNYIRWNMAQDGTNFPSRRKADKDADLPSGAPVLPGNYKIVVKHQDKMEATNVSVKFDPRRPVKTDDLKANQKTYAEYMSKVSKAAEGYNNIIAAKEAIKMTESVLSSQADSTQTQMKDMHKELNKKIDKIDKMYFEPENLKGIQRDAENLSNSIFSGMSYMRGREGDLGGNGKIAMKVATEKIEKTLKEVNDFFTVDWPKYQAKVEGLKPISVKKIEAIRF